MSIPVTFIFLCSSTLGRDTHKSEYENPFTHFVRNVSTHLKYLDNQLCDLVVICQQIDIFSVRLSQSFWVIPLSEIVYCVIIALTLIN